MAIKVTGQFEPAGSFAIVDGKDISGAITGSHYSGSASSTGSFGRVETGYIEVKEIGGQQRGVTVTGSLYVSGSAGASKGDISASGDIVADGDVIAYNSSDERLKDNIEVIKGSLDKIDGIRGVEFDWNEKAPGWARKRGHDVGVIAQEVQKVLPEIVIERKNGYLGVDYKRIIPLLIESIKELRQEVNDLKKKVV